MYDFKTKADGHMTGNEDLRPDLGWVASMDLVIKKSVNRNIPFVFAHCDDIKEQISSFSLW